MHNCRQYSELSEHRHPLSFWLVPSLPTFLTSGYILMKRNFLTHIHPSGLALLALFLLCSVAQQAIGQEKESTDSSGNYWLYLMIVVVLAGLGAAFYFWRKSKTGIEQPQYNYKNRYKDYYNNGTYEFGHVDADKELEWLRKAKKSKVNGKQSGKPAKGGQTAPAVTAAAEPSYLDTRVFQEKMRKLQYAQLPINSFNGLAPARDFMPLPLSNDPALLSAVEQINEEYEEDESVRELAVRILAAFRTSNAVDALYQVALYDLSSNLRSKAVSILTDFDHESVFEAIVLACADPTREVRAAAARGLFRLNFDRAGAWTRLSETGDNFRMSHAVRAAIESGIAQKSFDRLVHEDLKISYEAFCLVALMIRSGEDQEIFDTIRDHKDERVKFALLHVIKSIKDERSLNGLKDLYTNSRCSADVLERVREIIRSLEHVLA